MLEYTSLAIKVYLRLIWMLYCWRRHGNLASLRIATQLAMFIVQINRLVAPKRAVDKSSPP